MNKNQEIQNLKKEITGLQEKIKELDNSWKRALADYQNLEKRVREEKEEWMNFTARSLIEKLLTILDNLEKAAEYLKDEGLNIAVKQLKDLLKSEGVVEISSLGEKFDPNLHECIDTEVSDKDNIIINEYIKGYKLKNRLLRPAKVKVGKE